MLRRPPQHDREDRSPGAHRSWVYRPDGLVQVAIDPRGLRTTFAYDGFGNVASVLYSDGGIVTNQYDVSNRLTTQIDQIGRITSFGYDLADNVISVTNAAGEMTRYIYDTCLRIAVVDPLGNRTVTTYDRFQNPTSVTDPLGNVRP